jgi:membrane protein
VLVAADWIVAFVLTATLIAAVFRYVPRAPVGWRDVWPGAILSTFLFLAGRLLLAFYLQWGAMSSVQGAVGSVVVLLLWIYFMAQVVFLGAEFTRLYASRFGSGAGANAGPHGGAAGGENELRNP